MTEIELIINYPPGTEILILWFGILRRAVVQGIALDGNLDIHVDGLEYHRPGHVTPTVVRPSQVELRRDILTGHWIRVKHE